MRIASVATLLVSSSTVSALSPAFVVHRRGISSTSLKMAEATKLSQDELKKMVGYKAVDDYVKSGMVVGLGTGSTAYYAVERVGEKLKSGELKDILAIPTSIRTKEQAESLGIPLVTLDTHSKLDVAIDGADEVDPDLNLVKGGGGALLREKMVEICADKFIVIVDESKLCDGLGPGFPVPVEITPFCHEHTMRTIAALDSCAGCNPVLRMGSSSNNQVDGNEIAITDNGNYIVDLHFEKAIKNAPKMAEELKNVCGVVDHGLFCGLTTAVIIAGSDGISVKDNAPALTQEELKKMVGYKAVDDYVKSGMVVGLGTGSTAYYAVERVGEKLKSGELTDILAIPTSVRTKEQAESLGIPLVTLDTHSKLDVAIDGADEVDPDLNLVKGGGGALLREKMVEICADKFIVIVDESKLCNGLGPGFPVPVEITPFCHESTMRTIAALDSCAGCTPVLRMGSSSNNQVDGDEIAVTDNGNYIVDLHFEEAIKDAPKMAAELKNVCGVVDHGLFCGLTTAVIIAGSDGISVKE